MRTAEPEDRPPAESSTRIPLSQKLAVGTRLAKSRAAAIDLSRELMNFAGDRTSKVLGDMADTLERSVFKVAFAGQVKAGKSTLINVLVEQPELLPSDINPWTSVITRLHFGIPGEPKAGATFTFFAPDEWARLSAGGKTRELTERAFPDFNWDALKLQVEGLKARAAAKLGDGYERLLGTVHSYPATDIGLLNRYVGAGNPAGLSEDDRAGEFSDITKTADLYFDLAAFDFPSIVIDTPGVNDPFLIRDEITRQNLEDAGICVAVLTARQPLSEADLGLLRVLKGLRKDRLIVFINKVDELEGRLEVQPGLMRQVSSVLKREFPDADIPLIPGSAAWANQALHQEDENAGAPANALGEEDKSVFPELSTLLEGAGSKSAEALERSGLPALAVAISDAMERGEIAASIKAAHSLAASTGRNLIKWLETEARVLSLLQQGAGNIEEEMQKLAAFEERILEACNHHTAETGALWTATESGFHQALHMAAEEIARENPVSSEEVALTAEDGLRVRDRLEVAFIKAYQALREPVLDASSRLRISVAKILTDEGFDPAAVMEAGHGFAVQPAPYSLDELAAQSLAKDFAPAVQSLAAEGTAMLRSEADTVLGAIRAVALGPLEKVTGSIASWTGLRSDAPETEPLASYIADLHDQAARLEIVLARHEIAV